MVPAAIIVQRSVGAIWEWMLGGGCV
jgi:hypothetical protein